MAEGLKLRGSKTVANIYWSIQIWQHQGRWTLFRCSKSCAIDRGTKPANVQRNILQSARQQPSSSLEGRGRQEACFYRPMTNTNTLNNKDACVAYEHSDEYLLQYEERTMQIWVCTPLSSSRTSPSYLAPWTANFCSGFSSTHWSSETAHACSVVSQDSCKALKTTCSPHKTRDSREDAYHMK